MKFLKMLSTFLVVCAMSCCLFGQQITGSAIPDATANQLYLQHLSNQTPTQLNAYLYTNIALTTDDANIAAPAINNFKTVYQQAITNYNTQVTNGSNPDNAAFNANLANITATWLGYLQNNMSAQGYAQLSADIQNQKNNMSVPQTQSSNMACCYSSFVTQTITVITLTPSSTHVKVAFSRTVSGSNVTSNPAITHNVVNTEHVGGQIVTNNGGWHTPNYYSNLVATVTLDSGIDTCLLDATGEPCSDLSIGQVYCSAVSGAVIWAVTSMWPHVEFAVTGTILNGMAHSCYWAGGTPLTYWCYYPQANWCTPATTPPDYNMQGRDIKDTSSHSYWIAGTICGRFGNSGPWFCSDGVAQGLNGSYNPFACTHNP